MSATLDIPRTLPVANLSVSSVNAYLKCPLKWKHRYLDRLYEPPSGRMVLGSSVGAAEGFAYQHKIDEGERPATSDVLDMFADEWDERTSREEIDYGDEKPGDLKDAGARVVQAYDQTVAPTVQPVSVEREFRLSFEGVDWGLAGFLDLETADGKIIDLKTKGRRMAAADARADIQPTVYLLARRTEGNAAAGFDYHTLVTTKTPAVEVIPASRTGAQLDHLIGRLFTIAAEIDWRLEHDIWQGAVPGAWWCTERGCGYFASCPHGGGA